jgi:hypothetical protein
MRKLTEKQEDFCLAYVRNGGNGTAAARDAGYSANTAREQAYEVLRLPHVRHRIISVTREVFTEDAVMARDVMVDLACNARSDFVRFNAAKDLLDRAGLKPPEKVMNVTEGSELDEAQLRERIETLMSELYGGTVLDDDGNKVPVSKGTKTVQ